MGLKYVLGRSGCGKTEFCYKEILDELSGEGENALIYIVPEQFSLEAEREIISRSEEKGVIRAQVLSFQRLAYHVFSEEGRDNKKTLEDIGKSMLLRKIVYDLKDELIFYKNAVGKQGFMSNLSAVITEFYKYDIGVSKLEHMIERLEEDTPLKRKLIDLNKIYIRYIDIMKENFITSDETLDLLTDKIKESKFLKEALVWIDGFHGFTPQELKIIRELMKTSKMVSVALCVNENKQQYKNLSRIDTFYETKVTINKIGLLAGENKVTISENVFLEENHRLKGFGALSFFEKNFAEYQKKYLQDAEGIKIYYAQNFYDEITQAAREIKSLVIEKGYRYREIGIVVNEVSGYGKILKGIFNKYEIPCFIDEKSDILTHPLSELIRSALDVSIKNWSYESVFRFLRTGLAGIDREAVDIVENYVLAYGIRGGKWFKEWTYGFSDKYEAFDKEQLNGYRQQIMLSLSEFTTSVKPSRKASVKQISSCIFKLLYSLNVTEKLGDDTQIWSKVVHVFDKMVEILGDDIMTLAEYAKVLEAGLETQDMGRIPPSQDQVIIGDLERSRFPEIRALLVLGVNEGVIPSHENSDGLLSDDDRELFIKEKIDLPGGKQRAFAEQLLIYTCLTKPSEFLYLSCCLGDLDGKAKQPSPLILQIKRMFPTLKEGGLSDEKIFLAKAEFGILAEHLRHFVDGSELPDTYKDIYNWFSDNDIYKGRLETLENVLFNPDKEKKLSKNIVKTMYGDKFITSVSQLEQYVECPFAYFVKYMLRAKERKLYQMENIDLGTIFHSIIESFFNTVSEEKINVRELSKAQIEDIATRSIRTLGEEELRSKSDLMASTPRYGYYMKRIENISKRTIWALSEHIKRGGFEPVFNEIEFKDNIEIELDNDIKMILNGKIDRVDVLHQDDATYIKIIDYKSGTQKLDLEKIYSGRQLQLLIYMDALMQNAVGIVADRESSVLPAAVFYFRIDNPYVEYSGDFDAEKIEAEILKCFKMSGLVLKDADIVYRLDKEIKNHSTIIPVAINKDRIIRDSPSVLDAEQLETVKNYAVYKAKTIGSDITSGTISAKPIKQGGQTGCEYCTYNSICQFDRETGEYNVFKQFASYLDILAEMDSSGKTVAATTLGCKVNFYDTQAMLKLFADRGYEVKEFDEIADIYIINTCSVTNLGDKKSRQMIRRAKKNNPNAIIVAAGCYSQVAAEEVLALEGVNVVVGTGGRAEIVDIVENYSVEDGVLNMVSDVSAQKEYEALEVEALGGRTRAYLKIQDGCDKFCSYCIIPFARGRVKSRTPEDVLTEVKKFSERGYKEIVFAGIHVASYGKDLEDINLTQLVKMAHDTSGIERIRLSSIDPLAIDSEFLDMLGNCEKICNHFHLSLQSGCNKTLYRMNRKYTTEIYMEVINNIRKISPDAAFTTDIIVGFPGETESDFMESFNFCKEVGFAKIHVFPYSAKKGTKAASFSEQVPPEEIKDRTDRMLELAKLLNGKFLQGFIGKTTNVLFEKEVGQGLIEGHTTNYAPVQIRIVDEPFVNIITPVKIVDAVNGVLFGEKVIF